METEEEKGSLISFYFITASSLILLFYISFRYIRRRMSQPPLPPGPKGLPLLGSLPFLDLQLHSYFANLAKTYGPILSIKLGFKLVVVVSSSSIAREILHDNDWIFANRDVNKVGKVLFYGANISFSSSGPIQRMLRKVTVRHMLGAAPLESMRVIREKEVAASILRIRDRVNQPVDIGLEMFTTAVDVITSKMWGGKVDEESTGIHQQLRVLFYEIIHLLANPDISDFFPILRRFDLQGKEVKALAIRERYDQLFEDVLRKKKNDGDNGKDFVDALLRMERESGGGKTLFTRNNLKSLLLEMILAGAEPISTTLEFAMAEMMNNPKIMKRAQEELDMVVGKDRVVQEAHIVKLQYLNAVIKETLRLHPIAPLLIPHCPSEPCTIHGHMVPKGTTVMVNVWAIHRDPLIWEKPLEFLPERFLQLKDDGGGWDFNGNDFRYIPFGSGRRICAGIGMTERLMPYMLASSLYSFNWKLSQRKVLDLKEKFAFGLTKAEPLVIVPTLKVG